MDADGERDIKSMAAYRGRLWMQWLLENQIHRVIINGETAGLTFYISLLE
jgi:hypothetical protein